MKFTSLYIKNFMSIGEMKISLKDRGIILVTGRNADKPSANSNGSGKSAIWDALIWCLYGRILRDDVESDGVIREDVKSEGCTVKLKMERGDNETWTLLRSRGVRSSPSVDLSVDGRNVSASTATTTQEKIDALVGCDFTTFASSVLFGQDTLRFAQLTDKEKKSVLERLLDLEIYEKAYKLTCQKISAQKISLDLHKATWHHSLEKIKELRQRWNELREREQSEIKEILEVKRKTKKGIKIKKKELRKLKAELEIEEAKEREYGALQDRKKEAQAEAARAKDLFEDYQTEISELGQEADKISSGGHAECPTCGQRVSGSSKGRTLKVIRRKSKSLRIEARRAERRYRKSRSLAKSLDAHLSESFDSVELGRLRAEVSRTIERIGSMRSTIEHSSRVVPISTSAIKEVQDQIKKTQREIQEQDEDIKKGKYLLEKRKYWQNAFSPAGIRSYLLDGIVPFLNERANYYSEIITDGSIHIGFNTVTKLKSGEYKEKFSITANNQDGSKIYGANSAGERQRIDLCVALALKDLARSRSKGKINLMVFDEAFERLDAAGCERIITLLNKEKEQLGSCFVITHNDSLRQFFTERMEIVKENRISRLEG